MGIIKSNYRATAVAPRSSLMASWRPLRTTLIVGAILLSPHTVSAQGFDFGCTRDGTTVNCNSAGIIMAPEIGLDPTQDPFAPNAAPTDTLNFDFQGFASTSGEGIGVGFAQSGSVEINVNGLSDYVRALHTAAGDDGQLTIAEFHSVAEDFAAGPLTDEIVSQYLSILESVSGVDTSSDSALITIDHVIVSDAVFFSSQAIRQAADGDGNVTALQIYNALPPGLEFETVFDFLNELFPDGLEEDSTISADAALSATQTFIQDGNEGTSGDPGILSVRGAYSAAAIQGLSGHGSVNVSNNATLAASGMSAFGIQTASASNFIEAPFNPAPGETGGPININNEGDIFVFAASDDDSGFGSVAASGIDAYSGSPFVFFEERPEGIPGAAVTIRNSGDITAFVQGQEAAFVRVFGIHAASNGGNLTIINSGAIDVLTNVTLADEPFAMLVSGIDVEGSIASTISINNSGDIKAVHNGIDVYQGDNEFGVQGPPGNVSVINSGNIDVVGGYGIKVKSQGTTSIENSGDVTLSNSFGFALSAENDGAGNVGITNSGALMANGIGSGGILAFSANDDEVDAPGQGRVSIDNSGQISVSGGQNAGISAFSGQGSTEPSITIITSANVSALADNSSAIFTGAFEAPGSNVEINIVGSDTVVRGGAGATEFGFSQTAPDEFGNVDEIIVGSAGIMMLGGGTTVINNAGTITAENGQAIRAVDGDLTFLDFVLDENGWPVYDEDTGQPLREENTLAIRAANDTLNNAGTVNGDVHLGNGANTVNNTADGVIIGNVTTGYNNDTYTNAGTHTGNVNVGDGSNIFSNLLGGIFNGNFFGGGDDDNVTNAGGSIANFDLGDGTNTFENSGGFQGHVSGGSGSDTLSNSGLFDGTVNLGAGQNSFTNTTDGHLASGDTFDIGAGNQVVNAGILFPGGRHAPGDEPGRGVFGIQTTHVTGNFVQSSSGTFEVDIDERTDAVHDRLMIDGSADLAGTVLPNIVNLSEVDSEGDDAQYAFTIITASAGASDSGVQLNVNDTIGFDFDLEFAENGTDVILNIVAARGIAPLLERAGGGGAGNAGRNGMAVVVALDEGARTSPALQQLANALRQQRDDAALVQAVERLTPKSQTSQVNNAMSGSTALGNAMLSCSTRTGEYAYTREGQCYWGKVTARRLDRDATTGHSGVEEDGVAFAAGIQVALQDQMRLGLALSYETTDSSTHSQLQALGTTEGDRLQAGLVLKNQWGPVNAYLNLVGGYGWFDHTRFGVGGVATADQDVQTFMSRLRLSYLTTAGALNVRPMVDFSATYISLDGYTEQGAGALTVNDVDEWFLAVTPALELAGEFRSGHTIVRPYVRGGVTFIDQDSLSVQSSFAGVGGIQPFTINSDLEDIFAVVEAGLHVLTQSGFNMRFTYDGRFGEDSQEHAGSLKASKNF